METRLDKEHGLWERFRPRINVSQCQAEEEGEAKVGIYDRMGAALFLNLTVISNHTRQTYPTHSALCLIVWFTCWTVLSCLCCSGLH